MKKQWTEVAVAIILEDSRCLITQRRPNTHLEGFWEFPGGKIHKGESAEECLQRELQEELGLKIQVGDFLETFDHEEDVQRPVRLYFFYCKIESGTPQPLEVQDFQWVKLGELRQYQFPPADEAILKYLMGSVE